MRLWLRVHNLIFRTVSSVLQNWPPIRYIVAIEQELISQNTIVKVSPHMHINYINILRKKITLHLFLCYFYHFINKTNKIKKKHSTQNMRLMKKT